MVAEAKQIYKFMLHPWYIPFMNQMRDLQFLSGFFFFAATATFLMFFFLF